jgi:hypothetical protein
MPEPRVLGVSWLPLGRAALCLDCEACYSIEEPACPACGSRTWTLLARFLAERNEAAA